MPQSAEHTSNWESHLLEIVRDLLKEPAVDFEHAIAWLHAADGKSLLAFDAAVRRRTYCINVDKSLRSRVILRMAIRAPEHADAYLFFESCNGNGYVRAQSLRAMRGSGSRLACAAALIRTEDWVTEVAQIALDIVQAFAGSESAQHLFDFAELIFALKDRHRFNRHWASLEPLLLAPRWRAQRRAAIANTNGRARRFVLDLVLRADGDSSRDRLHEAAIDKSPLVASWALAKAASILGAEELRVVLRAGLSSRIAATRAEAVRRYARGGYDDARDVVVSALFDSANVVRQAAAFLVTRMFHENPLEIWRSAFDSGEHLATTTFALAELGASEDADRLRSQQAVPRARLRAAVLRGLYRLSPADAGERLAAALADPAALVVRTALELYYRGTDTLEREALEAALARAPSPSLRHTLIRGSRCLGKWDQLAFILACFRRATPTEALLLEAAVNRWAAAANSRFTKATAAQRAEIARGIEQARSAHPARIWETVRALC